MYNQIEHTFILVYLLINNLSYFYSYLHIAHDHATLLHEFKISIRA